MSSSCNICKKGNLSFSKKIYCVFKRIIDFFGAITGIIFLLPLEIIIPIIIKCTSKGPVFFKQERLGKNKKNFILIKYRSMKIDAPEIPPSDLSIEEQKKMEYGFGSFLRRTSIDEIPQLFNILKGDMGFIGPRPGAAHNEDELIKQRELYTPNAFDVRPGLGGLAQIELKREHTPAIKAKLDHEYVEKMNFWLDCKIFLKTILGVFKDIQGR